MLSKITTLSFFILFISSLSATNIKPLVAASNPLAEVNVSIEYNAGGSIFVENCGAVKGKLIFTLENAVFEERKFLVNTSGAAQINVDYTIDGLTDTITFPATTTTLEFEIDVFVDGLPESPEDMVISVSDIPTQVIFSSVTTTISDFFEVKINGDQNVTGCRGEEIILTASSASSYAWVPAASVDNPTAGTVKFIGTSGGNVVVNATLGSCTATDVINITLTNSNVILSSTQDTLCGSQSVTFTAGVPTQGGVFSWSPVELFPNQNVSSQTITLNSNVDVIVSYSVNNCTSSDTILIRIHEGLEYTQPFTDTTVCKGEKLLFGDFTNALQYEFIPFAGVDFTDFNNPFLIADKDVNYTVRITSTDGACVQEYQFAINVTEASFDLKSEDSIQICKGDSTLVRYSFTPSTSSVIWTPQDSTFKVVNDSTFYAKPTVSTIYTGTLTVGDCVYTQSVYIRVDSIPEIPINTFWPKPFYCQGEVLVLSSPTYDKIRYPDITFDWGQALGGQDPLDQLNLTVITQDTFLYIRKTTNGACYQEDSIEINVKVPVVQFTLTDTLVCANEPVPVVIITDMEEVEWTPEEGVSCTDCKSVILTTPVTQTFTVAGKSDGCPAGGFVTVNIKQPVIGLTLNDTTICPNEPVEVSVTTPATNLNWSPQGGVSCLDCTTTTITTDVATTYTISGIQDGCPAYGGLVISLSPPINFALTVTPADNVAIGNPVTVAVVDPIPGASYQWKINGRDLGIHEDTYEIVVESDNDIIEAILISGQGGNFCTGNGSIKVVGVTPYIDIPNAFTPNGDAQNDVFKAVVPDGVNVLEITIVNRWGQKVFSELNSNNGWDGRFNEKESPSDTYVFVIKYQLNQGGIVESRRGEVTLFR